MEVGKPIYGQISSAEPSGKPNFKNVARALVNVVWWHCISELEEYTNERVVVPLSMNVKRTLKNSLGRAL